MYNKLGSIMTLGNGKNQGPWGNIPNQPPPDLDEAIKKGQEKFKQFFSNGGGGYSAKSIAVAIVVLVVLWLASGFHVIDAKEQGVVLRFGAFHRSETPGLNYRLPFPLEDHIKVPVTVVNRVEVGVRSLGSRDNDVPEESLMLTGDENIVDINFEVQWKIKNARDFLFNVREPRETVKNMAESAMREVVGRKPIADALAEGKYVIQEEAKNLLQSTLDDYKAGLEIVALQLRKVDPPSAVIDAFRDVQTARADKERARNEAETYRNDIIPRARGQAEQILQEAEAYKQQVVANSQGEAERFISVYDKYRQAKDITKKRIYLETMEEILRGVDKIMIDTGAQGSGVLPYLPLPSFEKTKARGQEQ